jgi:ABC-2 type transport system ATP-binding protein
MSTVLRKLQKETFVLSLRNPITRAPTLNGFDTVLRDDGDLEVAVEGKQDLNELFASLSSENIVVTSLRNKSNRLEELFIGLVENRSAVRAAEAIE